MAKKCRPLAQPTVNWSVYNEDVLSRIGPKYQGRRILLRDVAPITGGVAFWGRGEATVIDPDGYPDPYERLYEEVKRRSTVDGIVRQQDVFRWMGRVIKATAPNNEKKFDAAVAKLARQDGHTTVPDGYLVNLGVLLERGVAVCRQHAASLGYLAERLSSEGYIPPLSHASIDANQVLRPGEKPDGHAWFRFALAEFDPPPILIYDTAHDTYSSLSVTGYFSDWPYARPDEAPVALPGS